jgi:hypothetical protein
VCNMCCIVLCNLCVFVQVVCHSGLLFCAWQNEREYGLSCECSPCGLWRLAFAFSTCSAHVKLCLIDNEAVNTCTLICIVASWTGGVVRLVSNDACHLCGLA